MPISRENVGQLSQKYSERYYLMDRVIWCIKNIPNFDETVQKITISENVRKGVDAPTHAQSIYKPFEMSEKCVHTFF